MDVVLYIAHLFFLNTKDGLEFFLRAVECFYLLSVSLYRVFHGFVLRKENISFVLMLCDLLAKLIDRSKESLQLLNHLIVLLKNQERWIFFSWHERYQLVKLRSIHLLSFWVRDIEHLL